jgi:hypothetical protein
MDQRWDLLVVVRPCDRSPLQAGDSISHAFHHCGEPFAEIDGHERHIQPLLGDEDAYPARVEGARGMVEFQFRSTA